LSLVVKTGSIDNQARMVPSSCERGVSGNDLPRLTTVRSSFDRALTGRAAHGKMTRRAVRSGVALLRVGGNSVKV
jgi:hypothetical protein